MSSKDNENRRIPRPPNAFMLFGQQHRREIARQFPDLTNKQISKILGNEWRNMGPDDKSFYHRLADEAHADHMKKYPGYYYSPLEARQRKAERKRRYMQRVSVRRKNNENAENMIAIQAIPDESSFENRSITLTPEELGLIHDQSGAYQLDQSHTGAPYMHIDCGNHHPFTPMDGDMREPMERNSSDYGSTPWCGDHSYAAMITNHSSVHSAHHQHHQSHHVRHPQQDQHHLQQLLPSFSDPASTASATITLATATATSAADFGGDGATCGEYSMQSNSTNYFPANTLTTITSNYSASCENSAATNGSPGNQDEVNFSVLLSDFLPPMGDPFSCMVRKDENLSSLIAKEEDDTDYFTFACFKNESINDSNGDNGRNDSEGIIWKQ